MNEVRESADASVISGPGPNLAQVDPPHPLRSAFKTIVIAAIVVKEQGAPSGLSLASAPSDGSFAVVRFAPQATANDITNFLGAYKATVVEGPLNMGGQLYRIRLSDTKLPKDEVGKIVRQMQEESKIVGFIAAKE